MNSGNHSEERFFEVVQQLDTSERRPNSSKLLAARIVNSAITVVMSTLQFRKRHLLALFTTILAAHACYAAEGEFTVETGGVQIALGTGWETLQQPANYFVQKRGRNAERGIALSAGSFKLDLPVELYTAIGIGSLMSSPESQLDYLAQQVGVSRAQIEKAIASQVGKQLLEQVKQASRTMRFELVGVSSENFAGGTRFEIHSKMTILESGQTIYSRQFVLPGAAPREIVQITYGGASEDVFTKKDLADAIRPKTKAQ